MESSDMIRLTKGAVSGGGTLSAYAMISNSSVPLQDFRKIHSQGRNWKVVKFNNVSNFCYLQRKDRVRSFNFLTPSAFPRQRAVLLAAQVVWLLRHFHIFMISFTFNLRPSLDFVSLCCFFSGIDARRRQFHSFRYIWEQGVYTLNIFFRNLRIIQKWQRSSWSPFKKIPVKCKVCPRLENTFLRHISVNDSRNINFPRGYCRSHKNFTAASSVNTKGKVGICK